MEDIRSARRRANWEGRRKPGAGRNGVLTLSTRGCAHMYAMGRAYAPARGRAHFKPARGGLRGRTGAHPYIGGNMNRVTCAHCGKQFRNESGLAYHLGWAHKSAEPAEMADCNEEIRPLAELSAELSERVRGWEPLLEELGLLPPGTPR